MKITRKLAVSAEEFYEHILTALQEQVLKDPHQTLHLPIQSGHHYHLFNEDKIQRKHLYIEDYVPLEMISFTTETIYDRITTSYLTTQVDGTLEVTLNQIMQSYEQKKHHFLTRWFSDGVYLGRMTDSLYQIQTAIIALRDKQ